MNNQPSKECYDLIKSFEKFRVEAYPDAHKPNPIWTIGWGHTGPEVCQGMKCTLIEADSQLVKDVATAASAVNQFVTVRLSQNQFDALVSFVFNIGVRAFEQSHVRVLLNAKKYGEAADFMLRYIYAGIQISLGLENRRKAEVALFNRKEEESNEPSTDSVHTSV